MKYLLVSKLKSSKSTDFEEISLDILNIQNIIEYNDSGQTQIKLKSSLPSGEAEIIVNENHDSLIKRIKLLI